MLLIPTSKRSLLKKFSSSSRPSLLPMSIWANRGPLLRSPNTCNARQITNFCKVREPARPGSRVAHEGTVFPPFSLQIIFSSRLQNWSGRRKRGRSRWGGGHVNKKWNHQQSHKAAVLAVSSVRCQELLLSFFFFLLSFGFCFFFFFSLWNIGNYWD